VGTSISSLSVTALQQAYTWPQGPGTFLIRPLKVFLPQVEQKIQKFGPASYWGQLALRIVVFIVRCFFWMVWTLPAGVGMILNLRAFSSMHPSPQSLERVLLPLTSSAQALLAADPNPKAYQLRRILYLRRIPAVLAPPLFYRKWARLESIISEIDEQLQKPCLQTTSYLIGQCFFHIKASGSIGWIFLPPKMRFLKTAFINIFNFKEFVLERMKELVQTCGSHRFIMQEFAFEVSLGKDNKVTVEIHSVIPTVLYDKLQRFSAKPARQKMIGVL
jgi:hypothetical protein